MPRLQTFLSALSALALFPFASLAVTPIPIPPNGKGHGFISYLPGNAQPSGDRLTSTMCYCHTLNPKTDTYQYEKAHIFQHEYYNYHSNATFVLNHKCLSQEIERVGYLLRSNEQCVTPNFQSDNEDWYKIEANYNDPGGRTPYVCKRFARTEEEKLRQVNSKRKTRRGWFPRGLIPRGLFPRGVFPSPICVTDCPMAPWDTDPDDLAHHPTHDTVCFEVGSSKDDAFMGPGEKTGMKFNRQKRIMGKGNSQGRVTTLYREVEVICGDMCQDYFGMIADMDIKDKRAVGGSRQYVYTEVDDMCDNCK